MRAQRVGRGLLGAGFGLLAGCVQDHGISLGRVRVARDCDKVDCEQDAGESGGDEPDADVPDPPDRPPEAPVEAPPPTPPIEVVAELGRCDVPVSGELSIDLRVDSFFHCGPPDDKPCGIRPGQLRATADGGAWVIATGTFVSNFLGAAPAHWLLHYAADGSLLCQAPIWLQSPDLTVDDHEHAWVANTYSRGANVQQFDAACQALAQPASAAVSVNDIAASPGGVVLSSGHENFVALYDDAGQQRWSKYLEASQQVQLATGPLGVFVLGATAYGASDAAKVTVAALDAVGDLRWRATTRASVSSSYFMSGLESGADRDGNLVLAMPPPSASPGPSFADPFQVDLESIDVTGQTRWVLRVPSSLYQSMAVSASGDIYVAGHPDDPSAITDDRDDISIAVIAQDGQSCRRLGYTGVGMLKGLSVSANGRLWYISDSELGRFGPVP